jgi:hypothetical protein
MLIESESAHPPSNGEVSQGEAYIRINRERERVRAHLPSETARFERVRYIYTYVHMYIYTLTERERASPCTPAKRNGEV